MKTPDLRKCSDEALLKEHLQSAENNAKGSLNNTEAGRLMLGAGAERRASLAARAITFWIDEEYHDAGKVASALLRANQKDWMAERLTPVVEAAARLNRENPKFGGFQWFPHKPLIAAVEKAAENGEMPENFRAALERWKAALMPRALTPKEERELVEAERIAMDESRPWSEISDAFQKLDNLKRLTTPLNDERKLIERLATVLAAVPKGAGKLAEPVMRIDTTDAVGIKLAADLAKGGRATGRGWTELLQCARALTASVPPQKWREEAARKVSAIPAERFQACVADWCNEGGKAAPEKLMSSRGVLDATLFNNCSLELLKGLAWAAVAAGRTDVAPALGNLADACYKKVPNIGPRNVRLGNAVVAALAAFEKPEAVTQLSRLRLRVKHPSSRATIDKVLAALSKKTGISAEDLAEMSVPAFGLDKKAKRELVIGDCSGELAVVDSQKVALLWKDAEGELSEAVPASVRKQHGEELKRWKREAKDASNMLAAQSLRLERGFLTERSWPFETWRKRFLAHPLTGTLASRLIWQLEDKSVIQWNGNLVTSAGKPVTPRKEATISLWHPSRAKAEEVLAWRKWLEEHELTQPFKQAHREIYLLTDAERRTKSYSNRFAGHILRQHQFAALCQQRGWDFHVLGDFDSPSTPTLNLPELGLNVQFWVEGVPNQVSAQGIFLYVASDQVRFGRELAQVPPVVFSEVMRDIDLFVGVASVANDPTWRATPQQGTLQNYWNHWSFGELSESSLVRKQVLQNLVPKLRIAPQCSFDEKFLVVKGELRTYKIHVGSGNILMEPNHRYLCIVADRSISPHWGKVYLPFEGDTTLSLILSKAFLLAADKRIKDPTILRQINTR